MTILFKKNNQWLPIKNIYSYQNNHWKSIKQCYVKQSGIWQNVWQNTIIFINDIPQTSISIFELMGSPSKSGDYIFINNAEITANYGEPALKTGIFPKKSKLTIINNSYIRGHGGNGGKSRTDGEPGGDAILIEYPCIIDNNNGYLYGGGGGGGGFWVSYSSDDSFWYALGGSGGAGSISGISVENLTGSIGNPTTVINPTNGTINNGGGFGQTAYTGNPPATYKSGAGGGLGKAGETATLYSGGGKVRHKLYSGGAGGLAVNKNNFEVTVLNINEENIKGEIL
ncbi:hypothetical protein [Entomomonas asaccharolytica]|uniref:Receptor-recognising protein Gp38 domain-containing protein n=1 Tax=Entomomonas asaccharolytica TaxID=2785331 RepID=A0A974RWP3_9GAMM|nr:hypothetical protein [Entomomonas asaccharolytica]QQP85416.1 hypothetical protein JHT90_13710 [Entomomonas asaccharolytica]